MSDDPLDNLRQRISRINLEILALLNERMRVVHDIGTVKLDRGLELFDPDRESRMLAELQKSNHGPLTSSQMEALFRQIFAMSLAQMQEARPPRIP